MDTSKVQKLLETHRLTPNKLLGQNFLVDGAALKKIVHVADPRAGEAILEIGPGLGALTDMLAASGAHLVVVEKDQSLFDILKSKLPSDSKKTVTLVSGDILKLPDEFFLNLGNYRVVANIPYYLTARVLRKLLSEVHQPREIIVTIQKEVAERIRAKPPHATLLSLSVQAYGTPQIAFLISKSSFWPEPKVDSAVLKISQISKDFFNTQRIDEKLFFTILRGAFGTKRKTLLNSLAREFKIQKADIGKALKELGRTESARPEELGLDDWAGLIHTLKGEMVH